MVSLGGSDLSTMRMLIERLNWPVRMVKWRAAKEFGALLSSVDYSKQARDVYFDWLSSRRLESEVVSGLAILLCTPEDGLPSMQAVTRHVSRPSILADMMLQSVYREVRTGVDWADAHSGPVPDFFAPDRYFEDHKRAHVPPIISNELHRIEKKTGLPLPRQWAFEWRNLMDATNISYSGYPYYFVDSLLLRSGINGQFSQRQCDAYRSAFLRTLACAVSHWKMPVKYAASISLNTLPVNRNLVDLKPMQRPDWLADIPERCCKPQASLEKFTRELVKPSLGAAPMRPVSLKIPISVNVCEFGDLSITAVLATEDFLPDLDRYDTLERMHPWVLQDGISFDGPMYHEEIDDFAWYGVRGWGAPLCLDIWPLPSGFWHNDYLQVGISLPAPYAFQRQVYIACRTDHIAIYSNRVFSGSWRVWHDHWTPLYPKNGRTRCGTITELSNTDIARAQERHGLRLGWMSELRIWKRRSEYGEFDLTRQREFFLD